MCFEERSVSSYEDVRGSSEICRSTVMSDDRKAEEKGRRSGWLVDVDVDDVMR